MRSTSLLPLLALVTVTAIAQDKPTEPRWWKGNLHTHSLWSDGDDYPEMIADWYRANGYHFLGISDHNVLQEGQRWLEVKAPVSMGGDLQYRGGGGIVLEKYLKRFGPDWVEQRTRDGKAEVRLKPLAEYRSLLESPGRFLMIPAEEVSASWKKEKTATEPERGGPVHMNAINIRERVAPVSGTDAQAVMQENVNLILAQREKTGQPMFPHVNHPNYKWGLTAEDMMRVKGERFFEVYSGHPNVHSEGDEAHLDMDKMWDVILAHRLTDLGLEPMFGVGTDDSHNYHTIRLGKSNTGRGWVMVRAKFLTAESIVLAMEAGDFYASSGVTLSDVQRGRNRLSLAIAGEPGVTYRTQFIGTRRGFDRRSELLPPNSPAAAASNPHRRYSDDVGAVLAEVNGLTPSYTLKGDELYVRAKVISTKPKPNGAVAGEVETAWIQPLVAQGGK